MNNLIEKTLNKIKKEHITPIPKWQFVLKKSFFWFVFGLMIVLGSLAFGIILLQINGLEWDVYSLLSGSLLTFVMTVLPYFWFVLMCAFLALAYVHFRGSKTGYKYRPFLIVGLSLLISIVLGGLLYATGLSNRVENVLRMLPYYTEMQNMRSKMWMRPERGILAGEILEMYERDGFLLEDLEGSEWDIDAERAFIRHMVQLRVGVKVKIIGEKLGDANFRAVEIRPWFMPHRPPNLKLFLKR